MLIVVYLTFHTLVPSMSPQEMRSTPHPYTTSDAPSVQPSPSPRLEESRKPSIVFSDRPSVLSSDIPSIMPSEFQLNLSTLMI